MQERFHRAGALGIDLVQAVDRLIQFDAQFHLPADPIEVGDLPWPKPRGQIRQEKAIALRRVDPHEAQMQGLFGPPDMRIGINRVAVEDQDVLLEEGIEVGPGEELLGDVAAREMIHLGLPIVFEPDDKAYPMLVAGPQPGQAGIGEVRQQATPSPGLIDRQMPAAMTMARTNIPRCSLRWRSITPHCAHSRSMSCCGRIVSNTSRTSSPVM